MYYSHGTLSILFLIQFKFTIQAQLCHKFPSKINPEVLCNGFTDALHFSNLPGDHIHKLSFSKNKITTINSSSFSDTLSFLTEIYLDNNTITNITANAFKNLPNVEIIDLSNNELEVLKPDTFSSNKELTTIDLAGNNIKVLNINLINKLSKLQKLLLSKNPLEVCDPNTAETLRYLEKSNIETLFLATCEENPWLYQESNSDATTTKNAEVDRKMAVAYNLVDKLLLLLMFVILLLIIGLSCFLVHLCLKLHNKSKPAYGITRPISKHYLLSKDNQRFSRMSGEDEHGYMVPINPTNSHKYLKILPDPNDEPPISLHSENDLSRIRRIVVIPSTHVSKQNGKVLDQLNHLYEEIPEPRNFYENNIQRHQQQPYNHINIIGIK